MTVVAGVTIGCTPSTAPSNAAAYTNGLNADPGAAARDMVELALAVVPSADQCFDLPVVRIENDNRDLRLRGLLSLFAPARVTLRQLGVTFLAPASTASEAARCSSGSSVVVNAETLREQVRFGEAVEQMLPHHVTK